MGLAAFFACFLFVSRFRTDKVTSQSCYQVNAFPSQTFRNSRRSPEEVRSSSVDRLATFTSFATFHLHFVLVCFRGWKRHILHHFAKCHHLSAAQCKTVADAIVLLPPSSLGGHHLKTTLTNVSFTLKAVCRSNNIIKRFRV